ncbi:Transducin/WD40 repeat-like superfamily protein [Rhynchospora pubera]|uniref:Transducin/WD40 repeat-like superfamily protein n=1 Tax=Rhynchospora pubera TaxID=906938 RepID=A0AAV8CK78_9POAL|nr:Transducin/WD40 repeat-like superfamily protein [Rhynchospora pubera]
MSLNGVEELGYIDEEGEIEEGEFVDVEYPNGGMNGEEEDDEYAQLMRITDTSAEEARKGKDIQGIPWDRLQTTRQEYRKIRVEQYKNYENFPNSGELVEKTCQQVKKGSTYYDFQYNARSVNPLILHFQLRNLVWATSKHDVYFMSNASVFHWSSLSHKLREVLNFSGQVTPIERYPKSVQEGFFGVNVTTFTVGEGLLVAGGFQGELICKALDRQGVCFCARTTFEENAITNAIEIYKDLSGGTHFMISNNDCGVREYDVEKYQLLNHFRFPWSVNHTSISPDRKLMTVVGDDRDGLLVDSQNGKVISTLAGHVDYSFASAWHPSGLYFATGNQDKSCRVWDARNLSSSLSVLKGNIGAIRSVHYSSDGQFLYFAEAADFVHVYSTALNYSKRQEIDFFGEISGISMGPDDESLYIGVWDRIYASLLEFRRRHAYDYLDSFV